MFPLNTNLGAKYSSSYLPPLVQYPSHDLFSRQTVATPTVILGTHVAFTPQYEIMGYVSSGTGTIVHDISQTLMKHTVSGSSGRAVRQSLEYLLYQPGKLQTTYLTAAPELSGNFDNSVACRFGLFDDYRDKSAEPNQPSMGHFFELSGGKWFVVERANSYDNITNVNRVPQANWNMDTLNGNRATSASGYILPENMPYGVLMLIDRQWLGVGIVRLGFIIEGRPIFVHAFHDRLFGRPYTHLPKLPLRWEIEKVAGGSTLPATMGSICGTTEVIGDYTPQGAIFALPISLAPAQSLDGTIRPCLVIRLQQQFCRATLKLIQVDIYAPNGTVGYTVFKNPQINNGPALTYTKFPDSRSMVEYCYVGTPTSYTLTDGIPYRCGFVDKSLSTSDAVATQQLLTAPSICSNIAGNPDILVIAALEYQNTDIYITCRWLEIV